MSLWHPKRVLALAPHRDDYEIGAGGTIFKLFASGADIYGIIFSQARIYPPNMFPSERYAKEARNSADALEIPQDRLEILDLPVHNLPNHRQEVLQKLIDIKLWLDPDLILVPTSDDVHQDHAVVNAEAKRAFKDRTLLGYEMPWNNLHFHQQLVIGLTKLEMDVKLNALSQYESQKNRPYFDPEFITSWGRVRGRQINAPFGEAFEVIRWVIR